MKDHVINLSSLKSAESEEILIGESGYEPSYGTAYLESFPDYVEDRKNQYKFVKKLFERLIENNIFLEKGGLTLVLGTGHGPHEPGLSDKGLKIIGMDISYSSLKIAHQQAEKRSLDSQHVVADMIVHFPFKRNLFDAIFNLGTSFGFHKEDNQNATVFINACEILQAGGVFVFDYVNPVWITEKEHKKNTKLPNGSIRTEEFEYDPISRSSLTKFELLQPNGEKTCFYHYIKYYSLTEVSEMMLRSGLKILRTYGNADGDPFVEHESPQMIIIAQKISKGELS